MNHRIQDLGSRAYAILLTLLPGERHGYDIMRQVALDTSEHIQLGPATLYTILKRLLDLKLIEEAALVRDPELDDARRRYYRLTASGHQALEEELKRVQRFTSLATRRMV